MRSLFLLTLSLFLTAGQAQDLEIPRDLNYDNAADYEAQNDKIVEVADYLLNTPVNKHPGKRDMAKQYMMQWLTGTPTVSLTLSDEVAPFLECGECLMLYMSAYAKYSIQNPEGSAATWNYAAVKDVLKFYQMNKDAVGKNKPLEKFAKLEAKGKLEARIHAATPQ